MSVTLWLKAEDPEPGGLVIWGRAGLARRGGLECGDIHGDHTQYHQRFARQRRCGCADYDYRLGVGATQNSGAAWLGTSYATVVSWSDTQVVAAVAAASGPGVAQILQNGVWSNSVSFSTLTPQITSINPTSAATGAQVTFTGSGFGASQGSGIAWLGNGNASVVSWSDTQVVATVASGATSGSAKILQNSVWSNAIRFVIPTNGAGNNQTIVPSVLSMLVGDTRTVQALNSSGAVVTGLTWTSSHPTVVSLSTDDPPILTALAPGHVSITAGDSSADVTVYSGSAFPTGTVIWSVPGDGSGVTNILPAVPSPTGVADVFAVQSSGNVQAITADASVAWTASVGAGNTLLPDFQGGLVAASYTAIKRLNGLTGQVDSQYTYAEGPQTNVAIHTDGTIFTVDGSSLVGIDPATGSAKFSIPLDPSTYVLNDGCGTSSGQSTAPPSVGQLMIAGDGYAYLTYQYYESSETRTMPDSCEDSSSETLHYRMLRADTSGNAQKIAMGDWTMTHAQGVTYISTYRYYALWDTQDGQIPRVSDHLVTNADAGVMLSASYATARTRGGLSLHDERVRSGHL